MLQRNVNIHVYITVSGSSAQTRVNTRARADLWIRTDLCLLFSEEGYSCIVDCVQRAKLRRSSEEEDDRGFRKAPRSVTARHSGGLDWCSALKPSSQDAVSRPFVLEKPIILFFRPFSQSSDIGSL